MGWSSEVVSPDPGFPDIYFAPKKTVPVQPQFADPVASYCAQTNAVHAAASVALLDVLTIAKSPLSVLVWVLHTWIQLPATGSYVLPASSVFHNSVSRLPVH